MNRNNRFWTCLVNNKINAIVTVIEANKLCIGHRHVHCTYVKGRLSIHTDVPGCEFKKPERYLQPGAQE